MEKAIATPARLGGRRHSVLRAILRGALLSLSLGAALLLLAAYLLYRTADPGGYVRTASLAVAGVSAIAGGIAASHGSVRGGALLGFCSGVLLALLSFLVALLVSGGALAGEALVRYAMMLLGGTLGGMLGKRGGHRRRRHR